jgi:hypothetical protein
MVQILRLSFKLWGYGPNFEVIYYKLHLKPSKGCQSAALDANP